MDINNYIEKAKKGDQIAFTYLLNHYWNEVYGFMLKRTENETDSEDVTIETFSKAFDKLNNYNPEFQFNTWLIAIAKNVHIDHLRKKKIKPHHRNYTQRKQTSLQRCRQHTNRRRRTNHRPKPVPTTPIHQRIKTTLPRNNPTTLLSRNELPRNIRTTQRTPKQHQNKTPTSQKIISRNNPTQQLNTHPFFYF